MLFEGEDDRVPSTFGYFAMYFTYASLAYNGGDGLGPQIVFGGGYGALACRANDTSGASFVLFRGGSSRLGGFWGDNYLVRAGVVLCRRVSRGAAIYQLYGLLVVEWCVVLGKWYRLF